MKLWKISQTTHTGYDTFDAAIVAAETEDEARAIHPRGEDKVWNDSGAEDSNDDYEWAKPEDVTVEWIGEAVTTITPGVILASFHAGKKGQGTMNARTRRKLDKAITELKTPLDELPDDDAVWFAETAVELQKLLRDAYEKGYENGYAKGQ